MDRYGKDLASIFRDGAGKLFGSKAAFNLAIQAWLPDGYS